MKRNKSAARRCCFVTSFCELTNIFRELVAFSAGRKKECMDISPSRLAQVATCEKLRDTVTGISALHMSLQEMDGRSPSPRSSFKEMYLSSTQAMIRKKEVMVSQLKTLPPCTRLDCQDHKIPSTSVDEEIYFETSHPENENKIKNNSKPNKKKLSKKRKNKAKESTEEFIFLKRPPDQFPSPLPSIPSKLTITFLI
ncbi:hypothetical protein TNCV_1781371 [Trichonephila clavipes]|nr:hypothetical protein TNCV_1781371 [Trichonephila clavipes]